MAEIILVFLKGRRTMDQFGLHRRQVHLVTDTGTRGTTWYLYSLDFIPTSLFFFLVAFLLESLQVLVGMFRTMLLCVAMQKFISI